MSIELDDVSSGYNLSVINNNFQKIEDKMNGEVLWRKDSSVAGEAKMERDLDMDGFRILNADVDASTLTNDRAIRVSDLQSIPAIPQTDTERRGKVVTFDVNTGNPIAVAPASGSAVDVLNQLALPTGATLVGYGSTTVAGKLDSLTSSDGFKNVGKFLNLSALRAFAPVAIGDVVFVVSAASTSSSEKHYGGGYFQAVAKGSLVDDGGMTIVPATGTLAWVRIQYDNVYIEYFGAKGDGVTDSTSAILAAMAYGKTNHVTIHAGPGIFETSSSIPVNKRSGLVGVGREQTIFEKTSNTGYPVATGVTPDAFIVVLGDIYDPNDLTGASDASWVKLKGFTFRRKGLTGRANAVQYGIWAPKMNTSILEDIRIECGYYGFWGEDVWSNIFNSCQFLGLGVKQFAGFQIDRFRTGVHALSGTSNVLNCVGIANYQIGFNLNSQQYITLNSCTADGIGPMADLGETDSRAYAFINPHGVTMNGCGSEGVAGHRLVVVMDDFAVYDSTITINSYQGQIVQQNPAVSTPIYRIQSTNTDKFCSVSFINCNLKKDASLTNQTVGFIAGPNVKVYNIGSILDAPSVGGGATFTSL